MCIHVCMYVCMSCLTGSSWIMIINANIYMYMYVCMLLYAMDVRNHSCGGVIAYIGE